MLRCVAAIAADGLLMRLRPSASAVCRAQIASGWVNGRFDSDHGAMPIAHLCSDAGSEGRDSDGGAPSPAGRKTARKVRKQAKKDAAKDLNEEFEEMVENAIDITKDVPHLFNLRELVMPNYLDKESEAMRELFDRGMKAMSDAIANRSIPEQPDDSELIALLPDEWRPYLPRGLTWEGSMMIMGGGFTHHPINRKTGLSVTMADLGFNMTPRQRQLLVELAGPRFNKKKQTLRMVTDNYPIRDQNRYHLLKLLCKLKQTAIQLAELEANMSAAGADKVSDEEIKQRLDAALVATGRTDANIASAGSGTSGLSGQEASSPDGDDASRSSGAQAEEAKEGETARNEQKKS